MGSTRPTDAKVKSQMRRLSNPLLLTSLGVLFAAVSCTLITDVDRSKIPDGVAGISSGGDGSSQPTAGETGTGGTTPTAGSTSGGTATLGGAGGAGGVENGAGADSGGAGGVDNTGTGGANDAGAGGATAGAGGV
jgi:hypothetical protein